MNRISELTGCQATDINCDVLEHVAPPICPSSPSPEADDDIDAPKMVDRSVVRSYSALVGIVAAVGVALLAFAVWFVSSIQSAAQDID